MSCKLIHKAKQALATGRLALDTGDTDGSVNRSYYAVFYAAWAVFEATGQARPKTHSGLISELSQRFVKAGPFDAAIGAILSRLENLRLNADYTMRSISPEKAKQALDEALVFVGAVKSYLDSRC